MAEMAKDYHQSLQTEGINPDQDTLQHTQNALNALKTKISNPQKDMLCQPYSEEEIEEALTTSHHNKSPGMDGATYELWKHLNYKYKKAVKEEDTLDQPP